MPSLIKNVYQEKVKSQSSKTEHGGSEFGVPTAAITEGKKGANDE